MSLFIPGFLIFMNSCKKIENKVGRNQYANGGKGEGKARFPNGYSQRKSLSTRVHSPFLARLIAQYDGWQMTQGNTLLTPPRTRWKRNTLRVVNGWNRKPGLVRAQGEEKTPLRPPYLCVHLFPPRESFVKFGLKGACSQYPLNPSSVAPRRRSPRRRKQFKNENDERSFLLCPCRCSRDLSLPYLTLSLFKRPYVTLDCNKKVRATRHCGH